MAASAPIERRERALVALAGVAPDVDGLGLVVDVLTAHSANPTELWGRFHHVLGHNLGFGLALSCVAWMLARRRIRTALLVLLSFHLHLIGDLVGARGAVAVLVSDALLRALDLDLVRTVGSQRVAKCSPDCRTARSELLARVALRALPARACFGSRQQGSSRHPARALWNSASRTRSGFGHGARHRSVARYSLRSTAAGLRHSPGIAGSVPRSGMDSDSREGR